MLKTLYENTQLCKMELGPDARQCYLGDDSTDDTVGLFQHLSIELPGEWQTTDCSDNEGTCINTKDWQYQMVSGDIYANRIINGDVENYPYHLTLEKDGSIKCFNHSESKDYCKMIGSCNGCTL